jgi:putative glutathione S-transferase
MLGLSSDADFGDTVDFDHIKRHCYGMHEEDQPGGDRATGAELSEWTEPSRRG